VSKREWKVGERCWFLILGRVWRADVVGIGSNDTVNIQSKEVGDIWRTSGRLFRTRDVARLELATLDVAVYGDDLKKADHAAGVARRNAAFCKKRLAKAEKRLAALRAKVAK